MFIMYMFVHKNCRMKKFILICIFNFFTLVGIWGQHYVAQTAYRHYTSDTTLTQPYRPWKAALETFGINMVVWGFDRYIMKEEWAYINGSTIKNNFY